METNINPEKITIQRENFFPDNCMPSEWIKPKESSHGIKPEISTASHPQYPPHPRIVYAHQDPRNIPNVKKVQEIMETGIKRESIFLSKFPLINAARTTAKGMKKPTKPRYKKGGWSSIAICRKLEFHSNSVDWNNQTRIFWLEH